MMLWKKNQAFQSAERLLQICFAAGPENSAKAFVFGDQNDVNLRQKFFSLLLQHHAEVFELQNNLTQDPKVFEKGKSYIVPSAQPNFLIVHFIFEENTFKDSIFYDNTGWSIIHAYGLKICQN